MLAAGATPVLAQAAKDAGVKPATAAKLKTEDRDLMKLSEDGFKSMRAVHQARLAIFNGEPKVAHDLLMGAQASLKSTAGDESIFVAEVKTGMNGKVVDDTKSVDKVDLVPIDGQITLADSFVDTPAKKAHIAKANQNIAEGHGKQALDELKLAEVDASFTRVLMPLQVTSRRVDEASKLVDEKHYYEANLALKAAEDGLRIDTVALSEVPRSKAAAPKTK